MLTYGHFQDVHVMIFVGFGFLMTFLKKYGYSAVSINALVAGFAIQWYITIGGFIHKLCVGHGHLSHKITINLASFLWADFAAAAILITFGALIGKVSPIHMMIVNFL